MVVERPGRPTALVEIKSSTAVDEQDIRKLARLAADFGEAVEALLLSQEPQARERDGVRILPWQAGLDEVLTGRGPAQD